MNTILKAISCPFTAALVASSLAVLSPVSAATTVLDNFDTVVFSVSTLGPITSGPTSVAADSDIPGIFRQVTIAILDGTGSASSGNLLGELIFDNGALVNSSLNFLYTFPAYNLTSTGATSLSYLLTTTEPGKVTDYTLQIESADGIATGTGTLPIVAGLISIPLNSLAVAGTPFNDATKITFELRTKIFGTDMGIDSYGFDLPPSAPVPEAGTYGAIGIGGLLAGWSYRRRSMKA